MKEICEKFGISRPEQVIDMLGLWGDASDNIPGIPGIGEKTARDLIKQFDNIENLIEHADEVANPRMREKVKEFADQARMSRSLATIILDVPIDTDPDILERTTPDRETLTKLFDELEFKTFAKRIFAEVPPVKTDKPDEVKKEAPEQVAKPRGGAPDLFSGLSEEDLYVKKSEHQTIETIPHIYHLVDTPEQRTELISIGKGQLGLFRLQKQQALIRWMPNWLECLSQLNPERHGMFQCLQIKKNALRY